MLNLVSKLSACRILIKLWNYVHKYQLNRIIAKSEDRLFIFDEINSYLKLSDKITLPDPIDEFPINQRVIFFLTHPNEARIALIKYEIMESI